MWKLLLVALAAVMIHLAAQVKSAVAAGLTPEMETATRKVVRKDKALAAGLIRLHFHDCFIQGCDASVLLDTRPTTTTARKMEEESPRNGGLRVSDLIHKIRDAIFKAAGVNVSCADALVFAAHEATFILSNGTIAYDVDGPGRQDGVEPSAEDLGKFLPGPTSTFKQLMDSFGEKGLGVTDLVALSATTQGMGFNLLNLDYDRVLRTDPTAAKLLDDYKTLDQCWKTAFRAAMTKISTLKSEAPLFEAGFRKDCTRTNYDSYPPPSP